HPKKPVFLSLPKDLGDGGARDRGGGSRDKWPLVAGRAKRRQANGRANIPPPQLDGRVPFPAANGENRHHQRHSARWAICGETLVNVPRHLTVMKSRKARKIGTPSPAA